MAMSRLSTSATTRPLLGPHLREVFNDGDVARIVIEPLRFIRLRREPNGRFHCTEPTQ
jgi:hypothetical protein